MTSTTVETKRDNGYHLIVLAKNLKGYHNLVKLVSKAWTEGYYFKPRTDHKELEAHKEGLIVCSACLGGEVPQHFMDGDLEKAEETILWYKSVFGEDYYLELQRHKTDKPEGNRNVYEEQQRVNPFLVEMARKHGIKIIATNDSHFVNEEDAEAHDRLICISMMKRFADPTRLHYTKQEWVKSQDEMEAIFADPAGSPSQHLRDSGQGGVLFHRPCPHHAQFRDSRRFRHRGRIQATPHGGRPVQRVHP